MRVNRTLLYTGIFLVAIGGVVVAADLGIFGESILTGALRLWPLAVIALGLGLVLRRTRISLSSGMLAAAVPGLLIGSVFAVAPRYAGFCGTADGATQVLRREGAFGGIPDQRTPVSVSVVTGCGSLNVTTGRASYWRLEATMSEAGRTPIIQQAANVLSVESTEPDGWFGTEPDDWDLRLPTGEIGTFVYSDVAFDINAGRGDIDLAGTEIGSLSIDASAADVVIDASTAAITDLTGQVSFGKLTISLPEGDLTGTLSVNAGAAQVCVPSGVGLRVTSTSDAGEVSVAGVEQTGTWLSPDYATAPYRADLEVHADFGVVEINPIGGCK